MIPGAGWLLLCGVLLGAAPPDGPGPPAADSAEGVADEARSGADGLSLHTPYRRGKVPVVMIHGLFCSPGDWDAMIAALGAEPGLADRFQFWTFAYDSGDPLPYSASNLRRTLRAARRQLDPDGTDAAFDRTVLVGHSLGGLLSKMMVQGSGDGIWSSLSTHPFSEIQGPPHAVETLRECVFFEPVAEVRRVVFIATPHRGSDLNRGMVLRLGTRIIRLPDPLEAAYRSLLRSNPPDFFAARFRDHLPTSVDALELNSPILTAIQALGIRPGVPYHSIIARRPGRESDGLVPFASAHLEGAASELVVPGGHYCLADPAVIREVGRILKAHEGP